MKKIILALFAVFIAFTSVLAQKGALSYLDEKKGFKGIVLGDSINRYSNILEVSKKNGVFNVTDTTMLRIGKDVNLILVQVKEYQGLIHSISAVAKKEYGSKLFNIFISAYGISYVQLNQFKKNYIWIADSVELYFFNDDTKFCAFTLKDLKLEKAKSIEEKENTNKAVDDL